MSAKRLAVLVVPFLVLVSGALAQVNQLSLTVGRTFVSTQTIFNGDPNDPDPHIHFGNEESVAANYSRLLKTYRIFGVSAELPLAMYFRMDLHTDHNTIPADIGALFLTPSVRVNFFNAEAVTPWVSFGGGYGRFREAPTNLFGGPNLGPTGTNTGVVQFGTGLDVFPWPRWGFRVEARDFYSGAPVLNVDTDRSRQHNYYVGVGVIRRF
jgi:hypothetical protein